MEARVRRGGRQPLRRRVRRRAHAEPLSGVQPARQVPPSRPPREAARRRLPGDRPLCPDRARRRAQPHRLFRAVDARKDQSYVLHTADPGAARLHPVSARQSDQAGGAGAGARTSACRWPRRRKARRSASSARARYADFVAKRRPDVTRPGEIVERAGRTCSAGTRGWSITRSGSAGVSGIAGPKPLYVLELNTAAISSSSAIAERAVARQIAADGVSLHRWRLAGRRTFAADAVVRYRGVPAPCVVRPGSHRGRS